MHGLTRGHVAQSAGVHVETLRYYERRGLIPRPRRSSTNYRLYETDTVRHVRFVKRAQDLGFSLKEIKELLSLRGTPKTDCGSVRRRAETKLRDVEQKLRALRRMKTALAKLVAECAGRGPISSCPILGALDQEERP